MENIPQTSENSLWSILYKFQKKSTDHTPQVSEKVNGQYSHVSEKVYGKYSPEYGFRRFLLLTQ